MSRVLALVEHDAGEPTETSRELLVFAGPLAEALGVPLEAVVVDTGGGAPGGLGADGVARTHRIHHELLSDYAPEAWGEALAQLTGRLEPVAVVAAGSDRGNEVMAHLAARTGLPLAANCTEVRPDGGGDGWELTRHRWGGTLLEDAELSAPTRLLTMAPHAVRPGPPAAGAPEPDPEAFTPELDDRLARTRVVERTTRDEGITLATAPVVVAGGRGMGSGEAFAMLEELAGLLGGAVGCSRVATNNGWRPHSDQVGQTGTRVAPDLYIACGISGATQHWVGCMDAAHILAINIDDAAPLVTRADHAVIADLHEIVPAVVDEVRRRVGAA